MTSLEVVPAHGAVLAVLVASVVVHHVWMATKVMNARKRYDVKYPHLYAPAGHKNEKEFNCVQRGHQNSLENEGAFMCLLIAAGVKYPITAAIAGAAYVLGRIFYMLGYSSGTPEGRLRGGFLHIANLALMAMVGRWAFELLRPALLG